MLASKIVLRGLQRTALNRVVARGVGCRAFSQLSRVLAASTFGMPAMSPTMSEGNVVEWKVKEGQEFTVGDVLLEIETDKAQIDVESQEDGILAKIIVPDGSKSIKVGNTIAYLAELGDDISSLEYPEPITDASASTPPPPPAEAPTTSPTPKAPTESAAPPTSPSSSEVTVTADSTQTLLPSVAILLHENNISSSDAFSKIPASGPHGRLLKGDVLAYLGKITNEDVKAVSNFIRSREKLDLSNIELKEVKPKEAQSEETQESRPETSAKPEKPTPTILTRIISSGDISALEAKSQEKTGSIIPLQTLVDHATKLATRAAYASPSKQSVLYDPIFEDLLSIPSNVDRFSVNIKLPQKIHDRSQPIDLFDEILGVSNAKDTYIGNLTVEVTLNDKVPDSSSKATIFLDKFEYYLQGGQH